MVLGKTYNKGPSAEHLIYGADRRDTQRWLPQAAVPASPGSRSRQGLAETGIIAMDATPAKQAGRTCESTRITPQAGARPRHTPTPLSLL